MSMLQWTPASRAPHLASQEYRWWRWSEDGCDSPAPWTRWHKGLQAATQALEVCTDLDKASYCRGVGNPAQASLLFFVHLSCWFPDVTEIFGSSVDRFVGHVPSSEEVVKNKITPRVLILCSGCFPVGLTHDYRKCVQKISVQSIYIFAFIYLQLLLVLSRFSKRVRKIL